jgi:hypothetical protein
MSIYGTILGQLTPAITTLFSVSFLALTFLLGQYEQTKLEPTSEWKPYYYGSWVMTISLLFSTVSLTSSIAGQFVCKNNLIYIISITTLSLAIIVIIGGVIFLDYKLLIK